MAQSTNKNIYASPSFYSHAASLKRRDALPDCGALLELLPVTQTTETQIPLGARSFSKNITSFSF